MKKEMEKQTYSLKWNPNPPLGAARLVIYAVAAVVYTVMAWRGMIALPTGFVGISALSIYTGIGFLTPCVMWFSGWGLVIGVIGGIVGAGMLATGMPVVQAVPAGMVELVVQIPMLIGYRLVAPRLGVSPIGRDVFKAKGFVFFLVWPVIVTQLWSAISSNLMLHVMGLLPMDALSASVFEWWIGNMIATFVIGIIILGLLTPVVERLGLTAHGIIT
ncbi:MAG: hypothetical protein H8E35_16135 [Ardenticatenia bacterium]|nr:hypothetical protein [Ardenticatenia bacterium]